MKRILFVVVTLALLLSACGPQATPTTDPAMIQASAIAAANTMVAQTQAAIPSATPVPPTPVPSPTLAPLPTPVSLPTFAAAASPTLASSSGGADTCSHVMDMGAAGPTTTLRIRNKTNGRINGSIWTNQKNAFGQCGYIGFSVAPNDSASISVPLSSGGACYYAYAWVLDPNHKSTSSGGPFCINTISSWQLTVNYDSMSLGV